MISSRNITKDDLYTAAKQKPINSLLLQALKNFQCKKKNALDIGCGICGIDIKYLLKKGFKATALDKESYVCDSLDYLPQENLEVVNCSFQDYTFFKNKFDLINAQFSLTSSDKEDLLNLFENIKSSLCKDGIFVGQVRARDKSKNIIFTKEELNILFQDFSIIKLTTYRSLHHFIFKK